MTGAEVIDIQTGVARPLFAGPLSLPSWNGLSVTVLIDKSTYSSNLGTRENFNEWLIEYRRRLTITIHRLLVPRSNSTFDEISTNDNGSSCGIIESMIVNGENIIKSNLFALNIKR